MKRAKKYNELQVMFGHTELRFMGLMGLFDSLIIIFCPLTDLTAVEINSLKLTHKLPSPKLWSDSDMSNPPGKLVSNLRCYWDLWSQQMVLYLKMPGFGHEPWFLYCFILYT